jgi:hypothetical protein
MKSFISIAAFKNAFQRRCIISFLIKERLFKQCTQFVRVSRVDGN